jgi:DNA-binding transcriptional regulator GbsR (MarR family)
MTEPMLRLIERLGLEAERDGLPRIAGRILGFLMASDAPASLDQIAEALQVSRASVSTNCRLLEQIGAAEQVSLPGDRKDYYVLTSGFPDRFFDFTRAQSIRKIEIAEEALRELRGEVEPARSRIEVWRDFHAFILEELEGVERRWRARVNARNTGVNR